ncbi:MAG TPA: hypothetical protein PKC45_04345 [Gemmatales bacterium]|nr:hypothetical protein [Gemmatales bacterium]
MSQESNVANRFLPRIRQELDKLPLTDAQKDHIARKLLKSAAFLDTQGGRIPGGGLQADSPLFNFADKIQAVADYFHEHGITANDVMMAVVDRPNIMNYKPGTLISNIQGVVDLFTADGLTTTDYLRAALKNPNLFSQSPWTLSANITGLVERFAGEGLTVRDYLQAALKQPLLFSASPETVVNNVTGFVDRFAHDGLTLREYLQAALKCPSALQTTPETMASHITNVVERYHADGMTTRKYLDAALKQPTLFTTSPITACRRIDTVIDFAERGLFKPPPPRQRRQGTGQCQTSLRADVIDFLLRRPALMLFADENYGVREIHQRLTNGPTDRKFLETPRYAVENAIRGHLGHPDPAEPVPNDGFVAGAASPTEEQAKRFLLRALMHAGFIKSGSMER